MDTKAIEKLTRQTARAAEIQALTMMIHPRSGRCACGSLATVGCASHERGPNMWCDEHSTAGLAELRKLEDRRDASRGATDTTKLERFEPKEASNARLVRRLVALMKDEG